MTVQAGRTVTTVEDAAALVGQELGVSGWLEVTQHRVNAFADATGDHQWIHVDPMRAKDSPFGGTIAHGFLTLSLIPYFEEQGFDGTAIQLPSRLALNYGLNRVRFPSPVPVGSRIRARRKLLAFEQIDQAVYQLTLEYTVEIEGGRKPAMVAENLIRQYL